MKAIIMSSVCKTCPIHQNCCYAPILPLFDEERKLFPDASKWPINMSMEAADWCQMFDQETRLCKLGDKRPQACKQYVCRWINEKLPVAQRVAL